MILSPLSLLPEISNGQLIFGLGDRDVTRPEGAGFDLRLAHLSLLSGSGYLGAEVRQTPDASPADLVDGMWSLEPRQYALATTTETLALPSNLAALVVPRSTLYRSGVVLSGGLVAPGYEGSLTVGLFNASAAAYVIEPGARFLHILFMTLDRAANDYGGQWQGGRIVAPTPEVQA